MNLLENIEIKTASPNRLLKSSSIAYASSYIAVIVCFLVDYLAWAKYSYGYYNNFISILLYSLFWPITCVGNILSLFTTNSNQVQCMYDNPYCMHIVQFGIIAFVVTYTIFVTIFYLSYNNKIQISLPINIKKHYGRIFGFLPFFIILVWMIGGLLYNFLHVESYSFTVEGYLMNSIFEIFSLLGWNVFFVSFSIALILFLRKKVGKLSLLGILFVFTIFYEIPILFIYIVVNKTR